MTLNLLISPAGQTGQLDIAVIVSNLPNLDDEINERRDVANKPRASHRNQR